MQEEILIKNKTKGTVVHFFNTDINENNYATSTIPAILHTGFHEGNPIEFGVFDDTSLSNENLNVIWKRNLQQNPYNMEMRMDFVNQLTSNFISGRTYSQTFDFQLNELEIEGLTEWFVESMKEQFSEETMSFVFAEIVETEDLYANIKLERSFDVLNTLNIYNKVTGEYSTRESPTGVVFGKIEAIQKLTDDNGNRIRIPLRNVPVGIFVPSEDYPTPNDTDSDGNRLRLNYRPITSNSKNYPVDFEFNYFNSESAEFDNLFLTQPPLDGVNIHPTFSNVVYTNENGEFILHNVDVGSQVLFFEVNLLKQGLTKDEVALNFFPYPPNFENISIDTIPHFFYRAIPIDVVSSWGDGLQTGYTEVNISVNLDLRKWATYIIPPVSYKGIEMGSANYSKISKAPLTVQVRDMSKFNVDLVNSSTIAERLEAYPSKRIQMVEIEDVFNKNENQQYEWPNEFSQIKDKAIFFKYGYHAVKLPANIYDAEGYKTNKFSTPQSTSFSKGVWLCGYQLKVFLTKESDLYRTTGAALTSATDWLTKKWCDRDHFHCCLYEPISDAKNNSSGETNAYDVRGIGIGNFPYERAWSKDYPNKYKIPSPPTKKNFVRPNLQEYYFDNNPSNGPLRPYIESPRYLDGDLIPGDSWMGWNGWALSVYNSVVQYTDFATDVIGGSPHSDAYKYEVIGAGANYGQNQYFGCYANGYYKGIDNVPSEEPSGFGVGATSDVVNGEEYQRIEAGYGYLLFPSSMPRLVPYPSVLIGFNPRQVDSSQNATIDKTGYTTKAEQDANSWWNLRALTNQYNSYSILNNSRSIAMDLAKKTATNALTVDKLNIYRIIDGKYRLSYDTAQPSIPTRLKLHIGDASRCSRFVLKNIGEISISFISDFEGIVRVKPPNSTFVKKEKGETITLEPNGEVVVGIENAILDGHNVNSTLFTLFSTYDASFVVKYTANNLPGNAEFDETSNMYTKAKYKLDITYTGSVEGNPTKTVNINHTALPTAQPNNWWVKTIHESNNVQYVSNGINTISGGNTSAWVNSAKIENSI